MPVKAKATKHDNFSGEALLTLMSGTKEKFESQKEAGLDPDAVLEGMFDSWLGKLKNVKLTDDEKTALTLASNKGPWTPDQKR